MRLLARRCQRTRRPTDLPAFTYDFNVNYTAANLARFARSLCQDLSVLQAKGHLKWREVSLSTSPLVPEWNYCQPTAREIRAWSTNAAARSAVKPARLCTAEDHVLGRRMQLIGVGARLAFHAKWTRVCTKCHMSESG